MIEPFKIRTLPSCELTAKKNAKTWMISDMHFGHGNIIRFCNRPFNNTREMHDAIINCWNKTVGKEDLVIILGDVAYPGASADVTNYWLSRLNGKKFLIIGNHDSYGFINGCEAVIRHAAILKYDDEEILLSHHPGTIERDTKQWCIHGHIHNIGYLIDHERKNMNVSVEKINYTPISLKELLKMRTKKKQVLYLTGDYKPKSEE